MPQTVAKVGQKLNPIQDCAIGHLLHKTRLIRTETKELCLERRNKHRKVAKMGRQKSRNHMREQNRDPEIMESSNPTDAKFKTLVIKILNELRESVDELSENFSKEIINIKVEMEIIKENQSEMKNTVY